jgi:hypothetical protein
MKPATKRVSKQPARAHSIKPGDKWRQLPHTFHTSPTFMDYLHGDVEDHEAPIACVYEYARESQSVWAAADWRDKKMLGRRGKSTVTRPIPLNEARRILAHLPRFGHWIALPPFCNFLCFCRSFPKKAWNELSADERQAITRCHLPKASPTLPLMDAWEVEALGILGKFKVLADIAAGTGADVPLGKVVTSAIYVPAMLQIGGPAYGCLFEVDFSKSETSLVDEFRAWLKLPKCQKLLTVHSKPTIGKTGKPLDRLKDLAAWRLYRERDNDWNKADDFANGHRKKFLDWPDVREKSGLEQKNKHDYKPGKGRPFHNAQTQAGRPPNDADLFGTDSDALKAKAGVLKYLSEIMPREFRPKPSPWMQAAFDEIEDMARGA